MNRQQSYSSLKLYIDKVNYLYMSIPLLKLVHDSYDFKIWTDIQYGYQIKFEPEFDNCNIIQPSKSFKPIIKDLLIDSHPKNWINQSISCVYKGTKYCFLDKATKLLRFSKLSTLKKEWKNNSILSLGVTNCNSIFRSFKSESSCDDWIYSTDLKVFQQTKEFIF